MYEKLQKSAEKIPRSRILSIDKGNHSKAAKHDQLIFEAHSNFLLARNKIYGK